jgi:hypothetical protein
MVSPTHGAKLPVLDVMFIGVAGAYFIVIEVETLDNAPAKLTPLAEIIPPVNPGK